MDCIVDFYEDIVLGSVLLIVLLIFMRILLIVLIFGCIIGGVYGFLVIWLVYLFYMLVNSLVAFYSIKPCYSHFSPPPPFHILNFKIFAKSKTWQFLELKTRPEPQFLTVFTMFFARA